MSSFLNSTIIIENNGKIIRPETDNFRSVDNIKNNEQTEEAYQGNELDLPGVGVDFEEYEEEEEENVPE